MLTVHHRFWQRKRLRIASPPNSGGLQPKRNGLQPRSNGLPASPPNSDGLQATEKNTQVSWNDEEEEFCRFHEEFPNSPLRPDAVFAGRCWWDRDVAWSAGVFFGSPSEPSELFGDIKRLKGTIHQVEGRDDPFDLLQFLVVFGLRIWGV